MAFLSSFDCGSPRGAAQASLLKSFYLPPFAKSVSPVSPPASSEARNSATRAMSSGWPTRPSDVLAIICFLNSVPMTPAACAHGRFDEIGCEEGERDSHVDLSDAALLASAKFCH